MSLHHNPRIVTDGLVLALDAANPKSYPGSGTVWKDLSGHNNHATLVNSPVFNGEGFVFDGIDTYAYCDDPTPFDFGTGDFTLCITSKPAAVNGWRTLIGKGASGSTGYSITFNTSSKFSIDLDSPTNTHWGDTTVLSENNYYNFCAVFDRDVAGNQYINGILTSSHDITGQNQTVSNSSNKLTIGQFGYENFQWQYSGVHYSVLIYDRALSSEEIKQNFNATRGRFGI